MDRSAFLSHFSRAADATEYENQALSVGREFLPREALAVLDGGEATPAYWAWLCEQIEGASVE